MAFLGRTSEEHLRRSLWRWRFATTILVCIFLGLFGISEVSSWLEEVSPHIARLEINGVVEDDHVRERKLREVAEDSAVEAVILHLNTPGGTVVGGESLYEAVRSIREKKPVAVVMGDLATSAGYMIALGGDHIVARNGSLTGSIGVLLQSAEITELARKVGLQMDAVKSTPLKGSPSPFERMTPAVRASMQSVVDSFYTLFLQLVAKERKLPIAEVQKLADGRVYTGKQALELKLVDALGGEEEAIKWLQKVKNIPESLAIYDVDLEPKPKKWEEFLHNITGSTEFMPLQRISLQGLVAIW